jgi:alpha-L-fucosidase
MGILDTRLRRCRFWFTKKKDSQTLYAIVESDTPRPRATWKDLTLHSVRATDKTEVSVLGQNDQVVEYHPEIKPKSSWHQEKDGLHVRAMQAQRLQDNFHWPNPVVLKITNNLLNNIRAIDQVVVTCRTALPQ